MERKITYDQVKTTVDAAYALYKDDSFGISVALVNGKVVNIGKAYEQVALGDIAKIPVSVVLLSQNAPQDLAEKACSCSCHAQKHDKPHIPICRHGIRAVSAIEPKNDSDGKWNILVNKLIDLVGSEPTLDDTVYRSITDEVNAADTINVLAKAGYTLYDDSAIAIDLYARLISLKLSTSQLAAMGATIAADGLNPASKIHVFDSGIAPAITALATIKGPHHSTRPWQIQVGLPAKSSFGGTILAFLPGFGAIAVYSPQLNDKQVSIRATKAIRYIANTLGLNIFASARAIVE